MSFQKQLNPQFEIAVKVQYVEAESKPENSYYFFSYKVNIINKSSFSAQLISRHWIITDADGQVEEVRGAGVVGLQPRIQANQSFEYESVCPLGTASGTMKGSYQLISDSGESFDIEIPEFYLIAPFALH